jgi:hypothetical protein
VERLGICTSGRIDDLFDREIRFARSGRPDANGFVGETNMARAGVRIGIDRDRVDAEAASGAEDATGDFAAVGDQDVGKQTRLPGGRTLAGNRFYSTK